MRAFHSDPAIKAKYLDRVRIHAAADEIIHGRYWENGKGCAIGCTIHSSAHRNYETELGIPRMLAYIEDKLFEGMANGRSKQFPEQFLLAAKVGADLSRVGWKFLYWLLTEELPCQDNPHIAAHIKRCADVLLPLTKGELCDIHEACTVRDTAYAAAAAAATDPATSDIAAAVAAVAVYVAKAAVYAAVLRPTDADYAYAASYAATITNAISYVVADRTACYGRMADKLLSLMAQCE